MIPLALWPPNHTLTLVTVAYAAADNCGSTTTELLVSSSDSRGGNRLDAQVVDDHHGLDPCGRGNESIWSQSSPPTRPATGRLRRLRSALGRGRAKAAVRAAERCRNK